MDSNRDIKLLSQREVGVDGRIAGGDPLVLQADLAHDFESVPGEVFAQFIGCDALAGLQSFVEARSRYHAARRRISPLLYALGITENNRRHVHPFHLSDHLFQILAVFGGVEFRSALLLTPAERSLFSAGIGSGEL